LKQNYFFFFLLAAPATPTKLVPNRSMVVGSGDGVVSPLNVHDTMDP
jgi:hypothetical protein